MVSDIDHVIPPDGGWGWAVVIGCLLIHLFMDGLMNSFGVFYIEFNDYFHSDKGVTSLVGSLQSGMSLMAGPIASFLINKYGSRVVAVSGAVISSLGFILSAFVPNVYWLTITFGLIPGIGSAFMFVSAVVSVGHYFEKRRSLAMGIAVCGSGIGTFIFAPLTEYLVECYTWKGAVLFEAGIMLNCAIGGMLFKPLPTNGKRSVTEERPYANHKLIDTEQLHANGKRSDTVEQPYANHKLIDKEQLHANCKRIDTEEIEKANENCNGISHSDNEASLPLTDNFIYNKSTQFSSSQYFSLPQADVRYPANDNLTEKEIDIEDAPVFSFSVQKQNNRTGCNKLLYFFRRCYKLIGFSMCSDVVFVLFVASNCLTSVGASIPYIFLPDRAKSAGIPKTEAAFLLSAMGIGNTIARVIFGWIASLSFLKPSCIYCGALMICGLSTFLSPLNESYEFMMCYSAVFGACSGIHVCLMSIVLVEFVGIHNLTSSFGVMLLFKGIMLLAGVPSAGLLYDVTGSYAVTFYSAGAIICVAAILVFMGKIINQKRNVKHTDKQCLSSE